MSLISPLSANARLHGSRAAIWCEGRELNWAQLHDQVARFAAVLRRNGVGPGDRLGILADNGDLYFAAFFAAPWVGAMLVPLNTRLSPRELGELLELAEPKLVLVDEGRSDLLDAALAETPVKPAIMPLREGADSLAAQIETAAPDTDPATDPDQPASIFFTGGTTGRSKGAMTTHRTHLYNSLAMWTMLNADVARSRYLHVPPMFHVADALFVHSITLVGGYHVILPRYEAGAVIDAIAEHGITDIYLVPTMIVTFLDELEKRGATLPTLRRIYYGAMPMPEAVALRLLKLLPDVGGVQLYGQSESGPVITMLLPQDHDTSGATNHLRSAGQPMPGVEIDIVDEEGKSLGVGEVGEIVARSPGVMPGYFNDSEQTAKALKGGWLHTGDGGYLDEDGFLFVVDRIKDMIISGGENIYSIEVERAVASHPAVSQCAVIGVPDPAWGERVHVAVVLREGMSATGQDIQDHCRKLIAGYKLPRSFDFRESMPLSGPGKILKRVLRDEAIAASAA